jgi:signal transduction histidine kinase
MSTATKQPKMNLTQDELANILESYHQVAERLKESHETLQMEVRRLRDELASKNRELERKKRLAALGEMAAGLAHEIRNPLGGIQLYADMLRKDLLDRPDMALTTDKIISGVKTLNALVTDVLALTHTVQPKFSQTDVVEIIYRMIELVQPIILENQSSVSYHGPSTLSIVADQRMLERALLNLFRNAIDAAGQNGVVEVELERKRNFVIVQVGDNGKGISPEIADKLFNPFFTTKDNGTGLGLSIVHRIVEAHDGNIKVGKSHLGGASFTIKFPCKTLEDTSRSITND